MDPDDIDPQSRCRLPLPQRDALTPEAQAVYDRLADPGGGTLRGLRGPGGIALHSPALWRHTRGLNHYLRYEAGLGGRVRELAILVTARECDSQFEWAAHEAEARKEGVPDAVIEVVRRRGDAAGLAEPDAAIIALGRAMFGARRVDAATFARCLRLFGRAGLVDLVALMGNYASTAALLCAFDMQLDEGAAPPLPIPPLP
jgi:4-carboxymuconolactone decarboxylase